MNLTAARFRSGDVIKHKAYRDVCFRVAKCFNTGTKLKIKGEWVNLAFERSYTIDKANIIIELKDLHDWLLCVDPEAICLRYTDWIKL